MRRLHSSTLALSLVFASGTLTNIANAQDAPVAQTAVPQIDYAGFVGLTAEVAEYRQKRLLERGAFFAKAAEEGALILDTRSAAAFQAGHIKGAINLPFSDFTDEKLAKVLGTNTSRPILIYCNNNFSDNRQPIALKRAPLALNIPTFINLYGYGYKNVWELDGVMSVAEVDWVADPDWPILRRTPEPAS